MNKRSPGAVSRVMTLRVLTAVVALLAGSRWAVADCGDFTFTGCCDGGVVRWCEDDVVKAFDCGAQGKQCGFNSTAGFFDCVDSPGTPPPGTPATCPDKVASAPPPPPPPAESKVANGVISTALAELDKQLVAGSAPLPAAPGAPPCAPHPFAWLLALAGLLGYGLARGGRRLAVAGLAGLFAVSAVSCGLFGLSDDAAPEDEEAAELPDEFFGDFDNTSAGGKGLVAGTGSTGTVLPLKNHPLYRRWRRVSVQGAGATTPADGTAVVFTVHSTDTYSFEVHRKSGAVEVSHGKATMGATTLSLAPATGGAGYDGQWKVLGEKLTLTTILPNKSVVVEEFEELSALYEEWGSVEHLAGVVEGTALAYLHVVPGFLSAQGTDRITIGFVHDAGGVIVEGTLPPLQPSITTYKVKPTSLRGIRPGGKLSSLSLGALSGKSFTVDLSQQAGLMLTDSDRQIRFARMGLRLGNVFTCVPKTKGGKKEKCFLDTRLFADRTYASSRLYYLSGDSQSLANGYYTYTKSGLESEVDTSRSIAVLSTKGDLAKLRFDDKFNMFLRYAKLLEDRIRGNAPSATSSLHDRGAGCSVLKDDARFQQCGLVVQAVRNAFHASGMSLIEKVAQLQTGAIPVGGPGGTAAGPSTGGTPPVATGEGLGKTLKCSKIFSKTLFGDNSWAVSAQNGDLFVYNTNEGLIRVTALGDVGFNAVTPASLLKAIGEPAGDAEFGGHIAVDASGRVYFHVVRDPFGEFGPLHRLVRFDPSTGAATTILNDTFSKAACTKPFVAGFCPLIPSIAKDGSLWVGVTPGTLNGDEPASVGLFDPQSLTTKLAGTTGFTVDHSPLFTHVSTNGSNNLVFANGHDGSTAVVFRIVTPGGQVVTKTLDVANEPGVMAAGKNLFSNNGHSNWVLTDFGIYVQSRKGDIGDLASDTFAARLWRFVDGTTPHAVWKAKTEEVGDACNEAIQSNLRMEFDPSTKGLVVQHTTTGDEWWRITFE